MARCEYRPIKCYSCSDTLDTLDAWIAHVTDKHGLPVHELNDGPNQQSITTNVTFTQKKEGAAYTWAYLFKLSWSQRYFLFYSSPLRRSGCQFLQVFEVHMGPRVKTRPQLRVTLSVGGDSRQHTYTAPPRSFRRFPGDGVHALVIDREALHYYSKSTTIHVVSFTFLL